VRTSASEDFPLVRKMSALEPSPDYRRLLWTSLNHYTDFFSTDQRFSLGASRLIFSFSITVDSVLFRHIGPNGFYLN